MSTVASGRWRFTNITGRRLALCTWIIQSFGMAPLLPAIPQACNCVCCATRSSMHPVVASPQGIGVYTYAHGLQVRGAHDPSGTWAALRQYASLAWRIQRMTDTLTVLVPLTMALPVPPLNRTPLIWTFLVSVSTLRSIDLSSPAHRYTCTIRMFLPARACSQLGPCPSTKSAITDTTH